LPPSTGGGAQNFYAPANPYSGTVSASVPRFNQALGTLIQADFEWSATVTGTWTSIGNPTGTSSNNASGPAFVDTQPMGTLSVGYVAPYNTVTPSNDIDVDFVGISLTSGAFFNSLTGFGTIPMTWNYSGSTSLDTPAVGIGFSWGGSAHVTYFYEPVPEPSSLVLGGVGLVGLLAMTRRRRKQGGNAGDKRRDTQREFGLAAAAG
jgi:hypothetical protein